MAELTRPALITKVDIGIEWPMVTEASPEPSTQAKSQDGAKDPLPGLDSLTLQVTTLGHVRTRWSLEQSTHQIPLKGMVRTCWFYTQYADINGDGKVDMTCDDTLGRHWTAYSKGNGTFYYKYHPALYKWCGHAGSWTTWADINGDGKKDITCNDRLGRHWSRLSRGYSWGPSLYHGANWCKGGVTRYSNFWYDTVHPKAEDMICDYQKMHFIRPSLGNGQFHKHTWKTLNNWCHMYFTQYADVNGNGVDDVICSWKGNHWLLAH